VLVILNFSSTEQEINLSDNTLTGEALNAFKGRIEKVRKTWTIRPWGYEVFVYGKSPDLALNN
jgi:hypothetical protein